VLHYSITPLLQSVVFFQLPKSPLIPPFFKGGIFSVTVLTPLWKSMP
jgi:hypothetical protein